MAEFRNVEEVARRLRCSKWTVYRMVREGRLAAVRVGRRLLFRQEAVEELLARGEVSA